MVASVVKHQTMTSGVGIGAAEFLRLANDRSLHNRPKWRDTNRVSSPRKMTSIFGLCGPPRKHNHFVPDGYVPPRSRQKIISPPQRAARPPTSQSTRSSRNNTPSRRAHSQSFSRGPAQTPSSNPQGRFRVSAPGNGQTPPAPMPRSILKTPKAEDTVSITIGIPRAQSARSSPRETPRRSGSSQQSCYVGRDEECAAPPSRQKNGAPRIGRGRGYPYDGSYVDGPISVVDKYDEQDNLNFWKTMYPPGRRGPPAKSSLRPHARHPNIIFEHVGSDSSCGASYSSQSCMGFEDERGVEDEKEDPNWCKCEPCCAPLDWDHDPVLKSIGCGDRQAYRQCKLERYLGEVCRRNTECDPPEGFGNYLVRCYAYANEELNSHKSKHLLGYVGEHSSPLDVWVLRLHRGTISRLLRLGTAFSGKDNELFLRMLREECVAIDSERGSVLRRHLNETERRVDACNEQERNYKKILLLSQRSPMGVMHHLKRRDWR